MQGVIRQRQEYCRFLLQPFVKLRARVPELRIGIETETEQRTYWYEGGLRMRLDSVVSRVTNLEDFIAELADPSQIFTLSTQNSYSGRSNRTLLLTSKLNSRRQH